MGYNGAGSGQAHLLVQSSERCIDMLKNIIGGMAVGIANIIPGVSGGTMLVIMGLFDRLMKSLSDLFSKDKTKAVRLAALVFISQVLLGAAIGLVGFAKLIDWLFVDYATQTFFWFIGLVLFGTPSLLRRELRGHRISKAAVAAGAAVIIAMTYFSPQEQPLTLTEFPEPTLSYLLVLVGVGAVAGATMLFPGISGSLALLILGYYAVFKSYVANVTDFSPDVLVPLGFIGIGILLGIVASAKLTTFLLARRRGGTVSFILGLILASAVVLVPLDARYDAAVIAGSVAAFLFGGFVVGLIDRYAVAR